MWHVWGRGVVRAVFLWGNLRERSCLKGLDVDEIIILKWILNKLLGTAWAGLIWLRIRTSGGLM
jgi:hypothetical protein